MVIAIDLGASNIRIAKVEGGKVRNKKKMRTPKRKIEILEALCNLIDSYNHRDVICIGVAGFCKDGRVVKTPNMDLNNVSLERILHKRYRVPVHVENDAHCSGLAELYFGAARGKKNAVILTLGTGIGGAIIINGKLYTGNSFAGEAGHMILGNKEFEQMASGTAAKNIAREEGLDINNTYILKIMADRKSAKARRVFDQIGENLAMGILDICYLLDPQIVILGGGFAQVPYIYKSLYYNFDKYDRLHRKIPIIKSNLKDDAGLLGAASLARKP